MPGVDDTVTTSSDFSGSFQRRLLITGLITDAYSRTATVAITGRPGATMKPPQRGAGERKAQGLHAEQ